MRARINEHNKDILELKRQNSLLETQGNAVSLNFLPLSQVGFFQ